MIQIDNQLTTADLAADLGRVWQIAGPKICDIAASESVIGGTPVFTVNGKYVAQGWTEWTQGFQYGSAILQFEATGDTTFLDLGRQHTFQDMATHVTHVGVHDHGFNQVSTYGNLRRLMLNGKIRHDANELAFYELALKTSGAVQANRWTRIHDGSGFIHSFNGPHSLFCDTIRSLRSLALAHSLGHILWSENDERISLLERLVQHAENTARYNVYYGEQRDAYDVRGRVAHESIFNCHDGRYRCPSTQQGYSPFTTWTRGLSWIMLGYPEQLEFLSTLNPSVLDPIGGYEKIENSMRRAALAACDFFIETTPACGVPYWDTGAPGLCQITDHQTRPADPQNRHEPVDSSAAAIGAQGLLRLGDYLRRNGDANEAKRYWQAGLTVARTLLREPYLSTDPQHQGILRHVIYHRPRGWDHQPAESPIPCGESAMWGDYHLLELAIYLGRLVRNETPYRFYEGED